MSPTDKQRPTDEISIFPADKAFHQRVFSIRGRLNTKIFLNPLAAFHPLEIISRQSTVG